MELFYRFYHQRVQAAEPGAVVDHPDEGSHGVSSGTDPDMTGRSVLGTVHNECKNRPLKAWSIVTFSSSSLKMLYPRTGAPGSFSYFWTQSQRIWSSSRV